MDVHDDGPGGPGLAAGPTPRHAAGAPGPAAGPTPRHAAGVQRRPAGGPQ